MSSPAKNGRTPRRNMVWPWLFDLDVTLFGRSNSCTFVYKDQKIRINPIEPKPKAPSKNNKVLDKSKSLHLVSAKKMERFAQKKSVIFALVATDSTTEPPLDTPQRPYQFWQNSPRYSLWNSQITYCPCVISNTR